MTKTVYGGPSTVRGKTGVHYFDTTTGVPCQIVPMFMRAATTPQGPFDLANGVMAPNKSYNPDHISSAVFNLRTIFDANYEDYTLVLDTSSRRLSWVKKIDAGPYADETGSRVDLMQIRNGRVKEFCEKVLRLRP